MRWALDTLIEKQMREKRNKLLVSVVICTGIPIKISPHFLQKKNGFVAHYYDVLQVLSSSMAAGLFGTRDKAFQELCVSFKVHQNFLKNQH